MSPGMNPGMKLAAALLALALLAGCGKKGSPSAPGPDEEVKFPRTYPSR